MLINFSKVFFHVVEPLNNIKSFGMILWANNALNKYNMVHSSIFAIQTHMQKNITHDTCAQCM
jgi:hypothetical protein